MVEVPAPSPVEPAMVRPVSGSPPPRRRKRRWPWAIAVLVVAGVGLFAVRRSGANDAPIDTALIVPAKRGTLSIEILETGKVAPREKVELKSKVAGQVAEVRVEEGARVKKGELLVVLDPTDYQREVARAEAEVAQARASIDFAKQTLDRKKRGVAESVVPGADLDAAGHQLRAGTVGLRTAQVSLGAAQDRAAYTKIVSPIDGTVIQRGIEVGEVVTPGVQATFEGKPLLTLADLSTLLVKVELNQIDVAKVHVGQRATVTLDALPGKSYEASITRIAPASIKPLGKDVEVFPVEAQLSGVDTAIRPGMTADVRVHLDQKPDVISLPIEAVVKEGAKSMVTLVLTDDRGKQRTEKTEVTVGARNDREIEIVSGLREGDRVLIDPASAAANETKL
jgi:HlyD family secretion protein/macrolide-specific efflux system membrane fusion protein